MDSYAFQVSPWILPSSTKQIIGNQRLRRQCHTHRRFFNTPRIFVVAAADSPSKSDFPLSPKDDSGDLPSDVREQFSQALNSLSETVGNYPDARRTPADAFLDDHKREDLEPAELFKFASGSSHLAPIETASDDSWTPEQDILLSLIPDDEGQTFADASSTQTANVFTERTASASPVLDSLSSSSTDNGVLGDASESVSPQSSQVEKHTSCTLDGTDVRRRLGSLKRRRHRLATERGEDAKFVSQSLPLSSGDASHPLVDMLHLADGDNSKNLAAFSLARARILDYDADASAVRGCALTTNSERLTEQVMRCPFLYRPFFGLQAAFDRIDNPLCPRCRRPAPIEEMLKFDSICGGCYSEIYLEGASSFSANSSSRVWQKETTREKVLEETRAMEEAVTVSTELLRSQYAVSRQNGQTSGSVAMTTREGKQSPASTTKITTANSQFGSPSERSDSTGNNEPSLRGSPSAGDGWNVRASRRSMRTINPIRNLIQNIDVKPNPDKDLIKLSVGDPTVYGNLKTNERAVDRFCEVIQSNRANGYSMSMGSEEARSAVARRYSTPQSQLTAEDVVLTGGTSGALEIAIGAIANEGDNVLLPRPGFPLFRTIAEGYGVECRYYSVNPASNWEIELSDLVELSDSRTAAIIVNNPSNPCGSVFSATHIEDLLATASMLKVPIIADEVYADMVFSNRSFTSIASKSVDVPVLSVGGVSKQFVVPGWRLGWILIHDRNGVFEKGDIRKGIRQLTTRMLVPNTPTQAVLPTLLANGTHDPAFRATMGELEQNAAFTVKALASARGVRCIEPQGAMYVMAEIDVGLLGFKDDMEFTEKLLEEESVFVLPGQCFQAPNFVRIVFSAPKEVLSEAFFRIRSFCARHSGSL